jgi:hypothetical protein
MSRSLEPALQLLDVIAAHCPPHEPGIRHLAQIRLQLIRWRFAGLGGYHFKIGITRETEQRIARALSRVTAPWLRARAGKFLYVTAAPPQFRRTDQKMVRLELHLDRYSRYAGSCHE